MLKNSLLLFALCVFVIFAPHSVPQPLDTFTTTLYQIGNKKYYLGTFLTLNWYKAAQYCRYHGMQLASITSEEENRFICKTLAQVGFGYSSFWIGGTDLGSTGFFYWSSTGENIGFNDFALAQPDNTVIDGEVEHCVHIWNENGYGYRWNDYLCSRELHFICEVDLQQEE